MWIVPAAALLGAAAIGLLTRPAWLLPRGGGQQAIAVADSAATDSMPADTAGVPSAPDEPAAGTTFPGPVSGMTFAWIPTGSFQMGSPASEKDRFLNEEPVHTVTIQGFQMMTTEVTQGIWMDVMGNNPSFYAGDPSMPVENVSWDDCHEFIEELNGMDYAYEYFLLSESQWEYACRAGTTTPYFWGAAIDSYEEESHCWFGDDEWNDSERPHPVGLKLPNAWGLFDMGGNVQEWCEDCYHVDYNGAPEDGSPWLVPADTARVTRGGNYWWGAYSCRSASRDYLTPDSRYCDQGFRVARSAR